MCNNKKKKKRQRDREEERERLLRATKDTQETWKSGEKDRERNTEKEMEETDVFSCQNPG